MLTATLTWLSTSLCLGHLALLGYCQKWMIFLLSLPRNAFMPMAIGRIDFCKGLGWDSKIFFAADMASVITRI